jgi:hypothetical protein
MKRVLACAAFIAVGSTSSLQAAPQQLLGKSVVVTMATYIAARADDGTPSAARSITVTFYISSQGRAFVRVDQVGSGQGRPSSRDEKGPESRQAHFNGNQLVASGKWGSGAAQTIVSFDPSYRTCTANVRVGLADGKPFSYIGFDGKRYTATGKTVVNNVSCAIRDGNALG